MPTIPKISETFELLLALISVVIFDAEIKNGISDILVSFDEVIFFKLRCIMDSMTTDELLCKLEMEALIFSK